MKITTRTTGFLIDDRFTAQRVQHESGSVWVPPPSLTEQPPIFNFALSEVVDITGEFEPKRGFDDDYEARVRSYFDIKRTRVASFEDSVLQILGRRGLVRTLVYEKRPPGVEPIAVFGIFVNVRLDDDFCQEFSADCPLEERSTWEPLFWDAIRSWTFFGDARAAIDEQEAARADMYARIDRLVAQAEAMAQEEEEEEDEVAELPAPPPFEPPSEPSARLEDLSVGLGECSWSIPTFSRRLVVTLTLTVEDVDAARAAGAITEYAEAVVISLEAGHVYAGAPAPRARLDFADGKHPQPGVRLSLDGLDYGLEFSGAVDLQDGWVSLRGTVGPSYDTSRQLPIELQARLDPADLDWSEYAYRTPDELRRADPASVHHVECIELEEGADLSPLVPCTELRSLFLRHRSWGEPHAVDVPEEVFGFTQLESLTIHSIQLPRVPDRIGSLRRLERLILTACGLTDAGAILWRLPALRWLHLDRNALSKLPERIALPALSSVDLSRNQLSTVPAALFAQPQLTSVHLQENPLRSLPDNADTPRIALDLELEAKQRLLDFTYKGADGRGTVEWDDAAFSVASSPELLSAVDAVLAAEPELAEHADAFRFLCRRAIGLRLGAAEDYALLGNHRLGGMPDLPPEVPYPLVPGEESDTPYEFLAQLDCAALALLQDYLPRTGFLWFFLSTVHDIYDGDGRAARVLWFDGNREQLVSGSTLSFDADDYVEMFDDAYEARRLDASSIVSAPQWYAAFQNPHLFRGPAAGLAEAEDLVSDLAHDAFTEPLEQRFPFDLGVATYGFTQHEDPEHQASLVLRGRAEDWVTLLHVKSVADMQWGDAGDLFFVIHKSDLAKRDFSAVFVTMESS